MPAVVLSGADALWSDGAGEMHKLQAGEALKKLTDAPHLVCHAAFLINRLRLGAKASDKVAKAAAECPHLDLAELYAFVHPARFALPTPSGLERALGLEPSDNGPGRLMAIAREMLKTLSASDYPAPREAATIATHLFSARWPWAVYVTDALAQGGTNVDASLGITGLNIWDRLPEWEDRGPRPPPASSPVSADEAVALLETLVGAGGEDRPAQRDYCGDVAEIFAAKDTPGDNTVVLAEAGTGLGKTLGYLAPGAIWSDKNAGTVWISTYTKNLQRQLEQETARLFPDEQERRRRVVVRKGRENYLCLLNLQDWSARVAPSKGRGALFAALVARWARVTRDGDMVGGDFPAWLMPLFTASRSTGGQPPSPLSIGLTDRRGECIYSACPHYRKCFIERVQRSARQADLVIANHALVMTQAAQASAFEAMEMAPGIDRPVRLVFDEGHHVFDAADSAYSGHLTGLEMAELRRWIRGPESRNRRGRGLMERLGHLTDDDREAEELLAEALERCRDLPASGFMQRVQSGAVSADGEAFLAAVHAQVTARTENPGFYAVETECRPVAEDLEAAASRLSRSLDALSDPLRRLAERLNARLDDDADELESTERTRIEALVRGLMRRAALLIPGWRQMLESLRGEAQPEFVEWFSIESAFGNEIDVGMHRHWVDPTRPFAESVLESTDGVLITSATLKDRPPDVPDDWRNAEMRTGANHLAAPAVRHAYASPFDYEARSRLIVVNDVNREQPQQVAAAYRELFLAAGGGALGLFTAIARLEGRLCATDRTAERRGIAALCPACRSDRYRHVGRPVPGRRERLPARHRRGARRGRRAGQQPAPDRARPGPLAAAERHGARPARRFRR